MIYLNQAGPTLKRIKRRRKKEVINRLGPVYDRVQGKSGRGLSQI